ncbi:MAG: MFS transporter, partial [Lactobacillus sp.]|nr:MFS transporter [Lactobacillus sp.]
LAVSINTLIGSLAGMIVPMLLAAVKIAPGHDSFMAGIAVSVATALVLLLTRFGTRVKKSAENNN